MCHWDRFSAKAISLSNEHLHQVSCPRASDPLIVSPHASAHTDDAPAGLHSLFQHLGRCVHDRDARAGGRARAGAAYPAARASRLLGARSAHRRRVGEHATARGWLLPLGAARIRRLLGISERVVDVDVLARRHGDLSRAVQSISGVLRSIVRQDDALDRCLARHLERDGDQSPRRPPGRARVRRRRRVHHSRLSCPRARRAATYDACAVAALCRSGPDGRQRTCRRAVDRALELHRLGQRVDGAR